jgi:uncharacterized damage-inducible protein DinB
VTVQPVPSKAEILDLLRTSGADAVRRLRAIPAERFEQGRYENGWNARQILAHIAAIEWTYPRLLEIPKQAQAEGTSAGSTPSATAQGGMDAYNHRQVERRAAATVDELIAEFERNRSATIAAIEAASDDLFAMPIRSAGGSTGPLGSVIREVAVQHVMGHVGDIEGT